jgi:hypothetical protein
MELRRLLMSFCSNSRSSLLWFTNAENTEAVTTLCGV